MCSSIFADSYSIIRHSLSIELRSGQQISILGSADFAEALAVLTRDPLERERLTAAGVPISAMFPPLDEQPDDPEWLRAEEMLAENAMCPGERLLAQTLASATSWWSATQLAAAIHSLAEALRTSGTVTVALELATILRACEVIESAVAPLADTGPLRLRWSSC